MKKLPVLALFWGLSLAMVQAQSIGISIQQESVSFPFTRFEAFNPGVEVDYGFSQWEKGSGLRQLNFTLGYYFHQKVESAFYLKVEYDIALKIAENIYLDVVPALGYLHTFYPGEVYKPAGEGEYVLKKQIGRPHVLAETGLGFSFFRSKQWSPFVQYRFGVETPFGNGIPVFPHSFYQAGVQYQLK